MSTLGHASPSRSTLQHSRGLSFQGDCYLDHRHFTTPPGYGSATIDGRELRYLESSIGDDYSVSISEALRLSSCPIIPAPLPATLSSDLAGHLCGELDSAQDPLSSGYVFGKSRASAIDSPLVDHTRGYCDIQGHASGYITNPTYAIEQSLGYPQESGDLPTSGDLDNSFAGPTTYLGPIPSLHDCTSGQVIGSDAPSSQLSNLLLPLLQDSPPSDDFNVGDIPLPPERTQTEMAAPPQFISSSIKQPIREVHPWTPFPYIYPIPSPSNPTSYSTSDGHVSSYPFLIPNRNSSSRSLQECLEYPFPIHPHSMWPADPPGRDAGSKMVLLSSGTLDDHSVRALGDHQSCILSSHRAHPLHHLATYIPDNNTTGHEVDDYENVDDNKFNTELVVGLPPQLLLPPNQLPLPPRLHSRSRVSRIEGGSFSGTLPRTRHFTAAQSKILMKLAKAHSVCDPATHSCGWRVDEGRKCGIPINYDDCAGHFAAFHHIKDMAWNVEVICCWCPSKTRKKVIRKNLLRHLREAHLYCPRLEKGI
ncbi:hypothetical protein PISMIDRAFT_11818 [Pisolithus microcarpus 441]|uniref:Uncharacterized protein n=1 Tax=Pisolithus microcarpus 441 TaxID=765257 RepID=A0A0C9ZHW7_9AGAM|nr:hypothetical protein PISMIDRAFT_11818 [Pisolithus microcarpus 441]